MTLPQQYQQLEHKLPVFFRSWWLDTVCAGKWDAATYTLDGEIVAVWPFQLESKAGLRIMRNPLLTPYLGPLWISEKEHTTGWITELYRQIPKTGFMQCACMPEFRDTSFFRNAGFEYKERVTYLLDLGKTEEVLWDNIHPKRRNAIRKAQADLMIEEGLSDLELLLQWHKASFTEKGKAYPYSESFFSAITTEAAQHKASRAYSVKDQHGQLIGQAWFVYDARRMYCLLTATPPQTHRGAIALLIWQAIQDAKQMGLEVFDFEGSMDPGIAHFFQRFGGMQEHYTEVSHTRSLLWKLKQKLLG